jgi:putative restriction endonuclease
VTDFDDENGQFLILFGEHKPKYQTASDPEAPFSLLGGSIPGKTTTKTRPGQQRFRFQVLAKYGCKCAVCTITHPNLMKAAHLCGKAHNGSDDWRNGLPFCATHHDAFDAHLFTIEPETLAIATMPGVSSLGIGITSQTLATIHRRPHSNALSWRFTQTKKRWEKQAKT